MEPAAIVRAVRTRAQLSLRELAERAGTSHSTLSAYERGRIDPTSSTLAKVVRAAGFELDLQAVPRQRGTAQFPKAEELVAALELAAAFPARHDERLNAPVFGRVAGSE